jgi:hypothetical protein
MEPRNDMIAHSNLARRPVVVLCCLLSLLIGLPAQAQNTAQARLLKAAFVYNFVKFTSWPSASFSSKNSPLTLCVIGSDRLSGDLHQLDGRPAKGRTLRVLSMSNQAELDACNIVYVGRSEDAGWAGRLTGKPILSISQSRGSSRKGGIIELYEQKGKVRFIINRAAARTAGLQISSRLLKLADVIGG